MFPRLHRRPNHNLVASRIIILIFIIYVTFSDIVFLTFGVILRKWRIEKMPNSLQLQEKNNSMTLTMERFFVYLFFEKKLLIFPLFSHEEVCNG